jgi:hypothetical protein
MKKLLTICCSIKYDGAIPDRKSAVADDSPMGYKAVRVRLEKQGDASGAWGQELAIAIANVPTINELAKPPALSWKPVVGRADLKALARFVGRYGPLAGLGWSKPGETVWEDPVRFAGLQFVLRAAWAGDRDAIALIAGEKKDLRLFFNQKAGSAYKDWCDKDDTGKTARRVLIDDVTGKPYLCIDPATLNELRIPSNLNRSIEARVLVKATSVDIVTNDPWDFARLSFLRDQLLGRTRVCKNPNCPTPYFVYGRRRQVYCSHDCALATASRNYRKRVRDLIEREKAKDNW